MATEVHEDLTYTAQWSTNADFVVAVDEGPIRVSVSNPSIGTVYNGIIWKTSNASLGSIGSTSTSISSVSGLTASADFYPSQVGFAYLYATDSNGTRVLGSCSVLVTQGNEEQLSATASTSPVAIGEVGTFSCSVEGAGSAELSYRWYFSTDGGHTWRTLGWPDAREASISAAATPTRVRDQVYRYEVTASDGRSATTGAVGWEVVI